MHCLYYNYNCLYYLYYNPCSFRTKKLVQVCQERGVVCKEVDRAGLTDICMQMDRYKERVHQGVVADVSKLYHYPIDYTMPQVTQSSPVIHPRPDNSTPPVWLLLCTIKDPYNLGAILRTAYYLGVEKVIVTGPRCELSCTVSKCSAGTLEVCPVYAIRNAPLLLQSKVAEGWRVLAAVMPDDSSVLHSISDDSPLLPSMPDDSSVMSSIPGDSLVLPSMSRGRSVLHSIPVDNLDLACPTILVLGSEGDGIPPDVMSCVTKGVFISPGRGVNPQVDSLNVSVAAAIVIHKLCRIPAT